MPRHESYLQVGEKNATLYLLKTTYGGLHERLVGVRWVASLSRPDVLRLRPLRPTDGLRGSTLSLDAEELRSRMIFGTTILGLAPSQSVAVRGTSSAGDEVDVLLEHTLALAAPPVPRGGPVAELRSRLSECVQTINAAKADLGSDLQVRVREDGTLGLALLLEI